MKNKMDWKTLESKYILKHKYLSVKHDICEMPSGKIVDPYFVIDVPDWVNVIAVTDDNNVLFVRQYRHASGKTLLGLPSGYIEKNESPLDAAKRELMEETGYGGGEFIELASLSPNPALFNNLVHSFLAVGVKKTGEQNLDETEDVRAELYPLDKIKDMIADNEIMNTIYVAAFYFAFEKLEKMNKI